MRLLGRALLGDARMEPVQVRLLLPGEGKHALRLGLERRGAHRHVGGILIFPAGGAVHAAVSLWTAVCVVVVVLLLGRGGRGRRGGVVGVLLLLREVFLWLLLLLLLRRAV
jgi:hypothetical protein